MRLPCLTRPGGCDGNDLVVGYVLGAVGAECDFKRRVTRCDVVVGDPLVAVLGDDGNNGRVLRVGRVVDAVHLAGNGAGGRYDLQQGGDNGD